MAKHALDMNLLAHYGPHDLESAWMYFKHWVKGRPVRPDVQMTRTGPVGIRSNARSLTPCDAVNSAARVATAAGVKIEPGTGTSEAMDEEDVPNLEDVDNEEELEGLARQFAEMGEVDRSAMEVEEYENKRAELEEAEKEAAANGFYGDVPDDL